MVNLDISSPSSLLAGIVGLTTILILKWKIWDQWSSIPGPRGLPYVGHALQLGVFPFDIFQKWRQEYGNVFKIQVFGSTKIVVSGEEALREMLVTKTNDFAGRPYMFRWRQIMRGTEMVSGADFNPKWVLMKKTFINTLKMYGERLSLLERITQDIIHNFCDIMDKSEGKPINLRKHFHNATADIMASIIFGRLLDRKSLEELAYYDDNVVDHLNPSGPGAELDVFPWLRFVNPSSKKAFKDLKDLIAIMENWFKREISFNKGIYDPNNPGCVLDGIFNIQDKEKDEHSEPVITDTDIITLLQDMVSAGSITTSVTMYELVAHLASNTGIQQKIQEEVDRTIGTRMPCLSDRQNAPYIEACILETLRLSSMVPMLLPHKSTTDTTLAGYPIKKGTEVWPDVWHLHHTEKYWDEPFVFKPERFLDEDGQLVPNEHVNRRRLLSFGAGRRVCAGETLARNRLFLFVAMLLQKYTFTKCDEAKTLPTDPRKYNMNIILTPGEYEVKVISR